MPRLQQSVIDEFVRWASEAGIVPDGEPGRLWRERITILLQDRVTWMGRPDPTLWRSGDLHELFITHVASRQVDLWDLAEHGPDTVRDFLRFLDATDRLHPASTRVSTLLKELDRLAIKYPAAMADTSRWRLAKRVFTAIRADGLALDGDPAVLDVWAHRFNTRDAAGRRAVLGELMDSNPGYATGRLLIHDGQVAILAPGVPPVKHLAWPDRACDCGCEQQARFPPVRLPDPATLAAQVTTDGAGVLSKLAALAAWAHDQNRSVDDRGEIRKADRPALQAALGLPDIVTRSGEPVALTRRWRLAIELDVLQLRRTRVVPGPGAKLVSDALTGTGTPMQTLDLWSDIADTLIQPPEPILPKGGAVLRDWLQPWMPRFLGILYTISGTGETADVDTVTEQLLDEYADRLPPGDPDLFAALASVTIRHVLADLADHGAVTVTGIPDQHDPRHAATAAVLGLPAWATDPQPGLTAGLTDLGRYLVRRRLLSENAHAPLTDQTS